MTKVPYDPAITDHLQLAAELIALKPSGSEQVEWVVFLLTEMESMLKPDAYAALLTQLQERMASRLETDSW